MAGAVPRILIVGWDGATFDVIRPMMGRGELPNLARLMEQGAHGPLRSTIPPSSAVAWPTFMTGREPSGHGVFGFFQSDGSSYRHRLVSSRDVQVPCLWDWLGQAGYRTGVVNIPVTYPPRPVQGFLVSGMLIPGPEETFTHPPELSSALIHRSRPYPIESHMMQRIQARKTPVAALRLLHDWMADFQSSVVELLRNRPWDCFIVVYRATDIVQHFLGFLWHHELAARHPELVSEVSGGIEAIYHQLDGYLGELLSLLPPETTVLVVSDHGAGPSCGRFLPNMWLQQLGHLVPRRDARYRRWLNWDRRVPLRRILRRLGARALANGMPKRMGDWHIALPDKLQLHHLVDWDHTRAYVPQCGAQGVYVRLNLAGREPRGIVRPGKEAEALLNELADQLAALSSPGGRLLFPDVKIMTSGSSHLIGNRGPDLLALPNEEEYYSIFPNIETHGSLFRDAPLHTVGQHRLDGILIARGPAIARGITIKGARLVDVAPTALHLMGVPVPMEMDGGVLEQLLQSDWLGAHPICTMSDEIHVETPSPAGEYSPEEVARVEDALRALGYID